MQKEQGTYRKARHRIWLILAAGISLIGGCSDSQPESRSVGSGQAAKVVSLAPSNTELIYALNAQDKLAAVCTQCDIPTDAQKKEKAGSFVSVNLERIYQIAPDVVLLVNGQEALSNTLSKKNFRTAVLSNDHISLIPKNVLSIGQIVGKSKESEEIAKAFSDAIAELSKITGATTNKPRVFFCVWPEPLLTVGNNSFLDDAIKLSGGSNVAADQSGPYPHFSRERLMVLDPEILIMAHQSESLDFWKKPPWTTVSAGRTNSVYFLPEQQKDPLSRPTLRIVDGLHWLSLKLHPELKNDLNIWHERWKHLATFPVKGTSTGNQLPPRSDSSK